MNEISNHMNPENKGNRIFSYLSFGCGILELALVISVLFQPYERDYVDFDYYETSSSFPPFIWFLILILIGVGTTIISFIKKEPSSFYKKIGAIINGTIILLFATIILLIAIT